MGLRSLIPRRRVAEPVPERVSLVLATGEIDLRVRISARARRFGLRLDPASGGFLLVLPETASLDAGLSFARRQAGWIEARRATILPRIALIEGATVPLRGVPHLVAAADSRASVRAVDGLLLVGGAPDFHNRRVTDYLKREARRDLVSAVSEQTARIGRKPGRISLRDTKTRWGSCSTKGGLNFSWRLILAPPSVLRYVAAHEVAHLIEMNHSPRFWAALGALMPDYRTHQLWLKQNGRDLHRYG